MKQYFIKLKNRAKADVGLKYYARLFSTFFKVSLPFLLKKRECDIVFISNEKNRKNGWILEAICNELNLHWPKNPGKGIVFYGTGPLPKARVYFFSHYRLMAKTYPYYPQLAFCKTYCWYTHPTNYGEKKHDRELSFWMNRLNKVISHSSFFNELNVSIGVKPSKLVTNICGADPDFFKYHDREAEGFVGFCSSYYERKNPDMIFEIVSRMPHRKFLLLGRNWQLYPKFAELSKLSNFSSVETIYRKYPKYYNMMSVFVSTAFMEGGPIPLVEAMMSNVVPVATRTGIAPEIIKHGENGFIFDIDSPIEDITALIDKAFEIKTNVRETVHQYSWKEFTNRMYQITKG